MDINILIAVTAAILLVTGLAGCVIPILPGVPLAWAGLLAAHFCSYAKTPLSVLVATGITAIVITVLDTIMQPAFTKKFGGSKNAVLGATIGLLVSIFLGSVFILIAPFTGAFVGEILITPNNLKQAFKAALGSFIGFLLGTGLKMICVIVFIWIFVFELIKQ